MKNKWEDFFQHYTDAVISTATGIMVNRSITVLERRNAGNEKEHGTKFETIYPIDVMSIPYWQRISRLMLKIILLQLIRR